MTEPSKPAPAPMPGPSPAGSVAVTQPPASPAASFGRVADDGTVFVREGDDERAVGQVPGADPDEALSFFTRRYDALALEVELLQTRVSSGALTGDDARKAIDAVRGSIVGANAVGDLPELLARLDALAPILAEAQRERREAKAKAQAEARTAKEDMVAQAEKLAQGEDWRDGVNRFRTLLDEWKALPRLTKSADEALWHRFSAARTTYTKRRKAQFAEQAEKRETARIAKQKILKEAQALAGSTEWGPTATAFRDLMGRWKAAGAAPRDVDEQLWREFRGIQDGFFAARNAALDAQTAEFTANLQAKEALLAEYEPRVRPAEDLAGARTAFRAFLERWSEIGKVPRDAIRGLDARVRTMEQSLRSTEDAEWKRTDPEARARAEDTAGKLTRQIADLEAKAERAESRGDAKAAQQARDSAATYRSWLEQAEKAVRDFSR